MVTNCLEFFICFPKSCRPNLARRSRIFRSLHASENIIAKNWDYGHYNFSDLKLAIT